MEMEGTLAGCFSDFIIEPAAEDELLPKKPPSRATIPTAAAVGGLGKASFDCSICLDVAADPVVTLCGHLYCWPCIYRWLRLDDAAIHDDPHHCPVCKSPLSESSLIPIYGRGIDAKSANRNFDIPDRPKNHRNLVTPAVTAINHRHWPSQGQAPQLYQSHPFYRSNQGRHMGVLQSTAGAVLSEMAFAMLPAAFRDHRDFYTSLYQSPGASPGAAIGSRGSPRWRRQELIAESWLNQLWVFLFFCAGLCLVFF